MKRICYVAMLLIGMNFMMSSCQKEGEKQEEEKDILIAVDLGLSVKWASQNVGSNSKYNMGTYFGWGEIQPKTTFKVDEYRFGKCVPGYTKYNDADKKMKLDIEDDAARAVMGGTWRMPTFSEIEELLNKCAWKWVEEINEQGKLIKGFEITGPSRNSIFIPMGEWSENNKTDGNSYMSANWEKYDVSASLLADDKDNSAVRGLYLDSNGRATVFWGKRYCGRQVRAVSD